MRQSMTTTATAKAIDIPPTDNRSRSDIGPPWLLPYLTGVKVEMRWPQCIASDTVMLDFKEPAGATKRLGTASEDKAR